MSVLQNKIDFVVLFSAEKANVNGDPLNGNRPARIMRAMAKCPTCASKGRSATGCRIWENRSSSKWLKRRLMALTV